jgi:antitoxin VapB
MAMGETVSGEAVGSALGVRWRRATRDGSVSHVDLSSAAATDTAPKSHHLATHQAPKLDVGGRSQAVRIPREFELPGKEAIMRKVGERLIIEPAPKPSLIELLDSWDPIDEELPPIKDMLPEPVDL